MRLYLLVIAAIISTKVIAVEVTTECPYMKDSSTRNNPKQTLSNVKTTSDKSFAVKK